MTAHRSPDEVRTYNRRVWDMVLFQLHPVLLYVILQILVVSHLAAHPLFRQWEWLIYGGQFLGAWACLCAVILRESGMVARSALGLVLIGVVGVVVQYVVAPRPTEANDARIMWLVAGQLVPAAIAFVVTVPRYLAVKRELDASGEASGGSADQTSERGGSE